MLQPLIHASSNLNFPPPLLYLPRNFLRPVARSEEQSFLALYQDSTLSKGTFSFNLALKHADRVRKMVIVARNHSLSLRWHRLSLPLPPYILSVSHIGCAGPGRRQWALCAHMKRMLTENEEVALLSSLPASVLISRQILVTHYRCHRTCPCLPPLSWASVVNVM